MNALKHTILYQTHLDLHAKMVDFGGWNMPIHYGSQVEEHHAVRQKSGVFDVSHMQMCDVLGNQFAQDFLRELLGNDVKKLKPHQALYSTMLNPEGGVIDDLIIYNLNATASTAASDVNVHHHYRIIFNAGCADKDLAWIQTRAQLFIEKNAHLDQHAVAPSINIVRKINYAMLAVQGPEARAAVIHLFSKHAVALEQLKPFYALNIATADVDLNVDIDFNVDTNVDMNADIRLPEMQNILIARTGYTGEDGFEVMLPASHAQKFWLALCAMGVHPCGLGARDTLRLEAGMHLYGQDMHEGIKPIDCGLTWTLDHTDAQRNYIGKTALQSSTPQQQLLGLYLPEGGGVLRAHQVVHTAHGEGLITSGTFSPTIAKSIAMAYLPLAVKVGDVVEVSIRTQKISACVVNLPFVRKGKILI